MTASPCVGICKIDNNFKLCRGCYRSRLEIKAWHNLSEEQKQEIIKGCEIKKMLYGELN